VVSQEDTDARTATVAQSASVPTVARFAPVIAYYWGDDAEGVLFYLRVTGVPTDTITKALEQVEQEGTAMIQQGCLLEGTKQGLRGEQSPLYRGQGRCGSAGGDCDQ
jgi:hypothetical protein